MEKPAETTHPIHDLIASRWSPRAFDPAPVPAEQIRSLAPGDEVEFKVRRDEAEEKVKVTLGGK